MDIDEIMENIDRGILNGKAKALANSMLTDGVRFCGDLPLRKRSSEYMKQFSENNLPSDLHNRKAGYEDGFADCLRELGLIGD